MITTIQKTNGFIVLSKVENSSAEQLVEQRIYDSFSYVSKTPILITKPASNTSGFLMSPVYKSLLYTKNEDTTFLIVELDYLLNGVLTTKITIAVNDDLFTEKSLEYLDEVNNTNTIPKNYIDTILQISAFDLCKSKDDYLSMSKYYNSIYNL